MFGKFKTRSNKLERLDTGDYTPAEYERFLVEISRINRFTGDASALKKSLFREIRRENLSEFSVLDVGAGSGELLGAVKKYFPQGKLFGLELNKRAVRAIREKSTGINAVGGDAFHLPFADKSFDYAICSLFTHHFKDEQVTKILREMKRVTRRKIFVIDLHRHAVSYFFYRTFGKFLLSNFVWEDGSLSILRGFKPDELSRLAQKAGFEIFSIKRVFPYRLVLEAEIPA